MSLKEAILEELKEGDQVALIYGQSLQAAGRILRLTPNLIQIDTGSGRPRIELESIYSYDIVEEAQEEPAPPAKQSASGQEEEIAAGIAQSQAPTPEAAADWDGIRRSARSSGNRGVQRAVEGILDALRFASRQQSGGQDKIRDITARTLNSIQLYPEETALFRRVLGGICLLRGDFAGAEDHFASAGEFRAAAYAAQWGGRPQEAEGYLNRYILENRLWEGALIRQYGDLAAAKKDASALWICLRREAAPEEERLHCLIDCAVYLARRGGFPIRWARPEALYSAENLPGIVDSLPDGWRAEGFQMEPAPPQISENPDQSRWRTGSVKTYNTNCFGFLREEDGGDCYFYVRQVLEEDIDLRQALYFGQWRGLEVRYVDGVGRKGRSADAIELTDRGRAEARKRLARCREEHGRETLEGYIEFYSQHNTWGVIRSGGTGYGFYQSAVTDPFLRAYLDELFEVPENMEFKVTFAADLSRGGKPVAKQVAALEPFPEEDRQRWIQRRYVSQEEAERWQAEQAPADEAPQEEIRLPEEGEDPYPALNYEALAPWTGPLHPATEAPAPAAEGESAPAESAGESPAPAEPEAEKQPSEAVSSTLDSGVSEKASEAPPVGEQPMLFGGEAGEEGVDQRPLSGYIQARLEEVDLEKLVQDGCVKEGRFEGTLEEAKRAVDALSAQAADQEAEDRAEALLAAAKLVSQVQERHPDSGPALEVLGLGRGQIQRLVGQGLFLQGGALAAAGRTDGTRFLYLEALSVLSRNSPAFGWAFGGYLGSYFWPGEELEARVKENGASVQEGLSILQRLEYILREEGVFALGMLQLTNVLQYRGELGREVEKTLFRCEHYKAVRSHFHRLGITDAGPTDIGFLTELRLAANRVKGVHRRLEELLDACIRRPVGGLAQRERLSALGDESWELWMSPTGSARLRELLTLLEEINRTGSLSDRNRQGEIFSQVLTQLEQLKAGIDACPTYVSHHILRPRIVQLAAAVAAERDKSSAPVPSIDVTIPEDGFHRI